MIQNKILPDRVNELITQIDKLITKLKPFHDAALEATNDNAEVVK